MNTIFRSSIACLFLGLSALAADPQVGAPRDQVIASLGRPQGNVVIGRQEILMYPRGNLELQDGRVTKVFLVTEAERAERARAEAAVAEARAKAAAAEQVRLQAEGVAELERMSADQELPKRPGSEQVVVWRTFAAKYPGVDVSEQLGAAETLAADEARKVAEQKALAPAEDTRPKMSSHKRRKLGLTRDEVQPLDE